MLDATHKLAVVTGASTGIGLELARIAAKEKYISSLRRMSRRSKGSV